MLNQFVLFVVVMLLQACVSRPPALSTMQLRQVQSRSFEVRRSEVFFGVKSVLQDNGYLIRDANLESGSVLAQKLVTLADPSAQSFDRRPSCTRLRSIDNNNHMRDLFRKVRGKSRKYVKESSKEKERQALKRKCAYEIKYPKPIPEYDVMRTDTLTANLETNTPEPGQPSVTSIRLIVRRKILTNKARERGYELTRPKTYEFLLNQLLVEIERRKIKAGFELPAPE